jgi:hypothetical protein
MNGLIYHDAPSPEFVASVREHSVLVPLLITPDGVIVSGHRRHRAAQLAGLSHVPVIVREFEDEAAILEALVATNSNRIKTNEQIGREALALRQVERERSLRNRAAHLNHDDAAALGRWRDRAAGLMGVSGATLAQAAAVVERADELREAKDDAAADALTATLDSSVRRAYDSLHAPPAPPPADGLPTHCPQGCPLTTQAEREAFLVVPEFESLLRALKAAHDEMSSLAVEPGAEELLHTLGVSRAHLPTSADLEAAIRAVRESVPACRHCPACAALGAKDNRRGCVFCRGRPYVTARVWAKAGPATRKMVLARGKRAAT